MKFNVTILSGLATLVASTATAAEHDHSNHHGSHNHNTYAPLNISGTHSHNEGELMLSYKHMTMKMDGMRQGSDSVDRSAVYGAGYMVSPLEMKTEMHMVGAMYGLSDNFTFMGMLPYIKKSMDLRTMGGVNFTTKSEGIGDLKLSIIDNFSRFDLPGWSASYTLSVPTGAIDRKDDTPMANNARLAYPMQLGSGTYDITPALNFACNCYGFDVGAKAFATIRTNDNSEDYRLGNRFGLDLWAGKKITKEFAAGLSLKTVHESEIHGADTNLNTNMSPTNDTDSSGYEKATLGIDVFYKPESLNGLEFVADYTAPIYQDLNGYQMDAKHMVTFSIRKTF